MMKLCNANERRGQKRFWLCVMLPLSGFQVNRMRRRIFAASATKE